jgi:homoserine dehydrogenase
MREVRVGLAGLGHVGSAAARLLVESSARFEARLGARLILHSVCDRRAAAKAARLGLPASVRLLRGWRELVEDPSVDIVVELFGGRGDARALALESLRRGKDVVTANKALLSHHWPELLGTAQREGRRLAFEASVAGGIPIIGPLSQSLSANKVRQILGILNGTTNFILSRMVHDKRPKLEILRDAQRLGLAERNPTLDLNGSDTAHKLSVLASLSLGRWLRPQSIERVGIEAVELEDVLFAVEELGRTARLLGRVSFGEGGVVEAGVHPTLVPLGHPLAAVHESYNAVLLETSEAGDLMFYGRGAGPGPAASAVVGDILLLAEGQLGGRSVVPALWGGKDGVRTRPADECISQFFVRFSAEDRPGVLGRVASELGRRGVSIAQVYQRPAKGRRQVPIVIVTHSTQAGALRRAVGALAGRSGVAKKVVVLRML